MKHSQLPKSTKKSKKQQTDKKAPGQCWKTTSLWFIVFRNVVKSLEKR